MLPPAKQGGDGACEQGGRMWGGRSDAELVTALGLRREAHVVLVDACVPVLSASEGFIQVADGRDRPSRPVVSDESSARRAGALDFGALRPPIIAAIPDGHGYGFAVGVDVLVACRCPEHPQRSAQVAVVHE